jgi:phosphatidylinositol 4-kinase B
VHIDFGFVLSQAPGGSFSLESAPFKLTNEMVEVMGGPHSDYFERFIRAFTAGFLALRDNSEAIMSSLNILAIDSTLPCFHGRDTALILDRLKGRFHKELSAKECMEFCLDLISESYGHMGTANYDNYQWFTNGIMA